MVYNIQVIRQIKSQLNKCSEQINELHAECSHLKQQFEISRNQLRSTKLALHDITNENQSLKIATLYFHYLQCFLCIFKAGKPYSLAHSANDL